MSVTMLSGSREAHLQEMDLLYSPSRWCHRLSSDTVVADHVNTLNADSEKARSSLLCQLNVPYGPTARQKFDILSDTTVPRDAPIVVYIHGGYWQILSKEYSCFMAEPMVRTAQALFIAVDYELCPNVTMTEIVNQIHAAICQIHDLAVERGSRGIYLVGHSAGAHLAAIVMDRLKLKIDKTKVIKDDENENQKVENVNLIKGMVLISGIYDLRPMLETSENVALRMSTLEAWSLSPMNPNCVSRLRQQHGSLDIIIALAQNDSPAFREQSRLYHQALVDRGMSVQLMVIDDTDHFDVVERLSDVDYILTKAVFGMLQDHQRSSNIAEIVANYTD